MAKSIFFSWQSDTPSSNGRGFLRKAIEKACEELAADTDVSEAVRDEGLEVDSDTQGVAGQPPLVETIFKKIDSAAVFIADVSFTGVRANGGLIPNPNVLIEYGWAMRCLTHSRVISVMNEVYGKASRESLPFDLSHTRWPIRYCLDEEASNDERDKVRKELISNLKTAIKSSLSTITVISEPDFPNPTSKDGPARFRKINEALGFTDLFGFEKQKQVFLKEGPAMWLRLIPKKPLDKVWLLDELKNKLMQSNGGVAPLFQGGGYSFFIAEDGVGSYTPQPQKEEQASVLAQKIAFFFVTGEVWSIDTTLLALNSEHLYQGDIEKSYIRSLENYGKFLSSQNIQGPYSWVAGVHDIKGRTLGYPAAPGKSWLRDQGPICMAESIVMDGEYNPEKQTPTEALLPFFAKIFEKCAVTRPDYLPQK